VWTDESPKIMNHLPKLTQPVSPGKPADKAIHFSPFLAEVAQLEMSGVFTRMKTAAEGLSEQDAATRLAQVGPNVVAAGKHRGWDWRLLTAARNPLVILLGVLATISFATGDVRAGSVMTLMVSIGVLLRFVQEARADAAAEKLKAMINVTATVVRAGKEMEIPLKELVPGDVVKLSAGDMIPADVRLISANDLFITQSTLTGESLPVVKLARTETRAGISPLEFSNTCFLGTTVESGAASAVILATGAQTYFGSMAGSMVGEPEPTSSSSSWCRWSSSSTDLPSTTGARRSFSPSPSRSASRRRCCR
jgi:Mg2+-importing ATPase